MTTRFGTMDQVCAFLEGTEQVDFEVPNRAELLAYIARMLAQFAYWRLGRAASPVVSRPPARRKPHPRRAGRRQDQIRIVT